MKSSPPPIPRNRMVAPCGVDCALCHGHLRDKNRCPGCLSPDDSAKPPYCVACAIKNCAVPGRPNRFCFDCPKFPCPRLRRLDKRYRERYGMDLLDNLQTIQSIGIRAFVARQNVRWTCPDCGELLCVHRNLCLHCGHSRGLPLPR